MNKTRRLLTALALANLFGTSAFAAESTLTSTKEKPVSVQIVTNMGSFAVLLEPAKAPKTVANFLDYVKSGFYNGTIFHRVIPGFMIQGGGFKPDFRQKPTQAPIVNEADNGLSNRRGTIAMARTSDPDSATAQFFINVADNEFLDYSAPTRQGAGYAVFGHVTSGMDVVDQIVSTPTGAAGPFPQDVPKKTVLIESIKALP
ncbi:peptidylprolyl isomerase [Halothiobacillus sp.]|uniref:peptidylprolyl isomerase n=1 Tax=Halothiobacillus sp. TaxID=1891311 RepID=UPI00261DAC11|nr:peptidylprolyl isomerase [Halothiobacillus sp.]